MENKLSRRSFIKGTTTAFAASYLASAALSSNLLDNRAFAATANTPAEKVNIGQIKNLKVKVISETSWFDNGVLLNDIKQAGGMFVSQYEIPWTTTGVATGYNGNNSGGYCSLIEAELMDGTRKRILFDTGWNSEWMTKRFKEEGIDKLLRNREIDCLVISHEHFDHFWAIETVTRHYPDITIYIPQGFYQEGFDLLAGKSFPKAHLKNDYPHKGKLITFDSKSIHPLFPGAALVTFDVPAITRIKGEQAFVFNVENKGLVLVTGCCHMGVLSYIQYVKANIMNSDKIYGMQGGLHISPFENWDPKFDDLLTALKEYNIEKIGANHCTGYITAGKMLGIGLPLIKGTGRNRSKSDIYLGNGDTINFS
ncbi:Metallo-beta-lactamase superfamily protein [Sporomusa ovata DSM 2662]|uniref:Metal-dependent hydrolases of the beta-lactamase superfamily II n=1 Tax=Sporomusa ovata TaxID=2378 RepID=A0A0U1L337_9FIRM|nr:MBL fold metallo-hydrolase [Sporomusa ovata]EQB25190.1 metallo-beta-lactamase family protein [Sporomusa ovata DSM 2662]CQR73749.1 Metal-dependent hydrolases of the beta-lactamase superfamily II [Sporomusa ovata]